MTMREGGAGDEALLRGIKEDLSRLGFYHGEISGRLTPDVSIALTEIYGGYGWRNLSKTAILQGLRRLRYSPSENATQHRFRFGEMLRDNLLTVGLAVGFDESATHVAEIAQLKRSLKKLGFTKNNQVADDLRKRANRAGLTGSIADQYVKLEAIEYSPLIGPTRAVNVAIELLHGDHRGENGAAAALSFFNSMLSADVTYYTGHARYGTGPDFDRNFAQFQLTSTNNGEEATTTITDYLVLEQELAKEGALAGRSAWEQFLTRIGEGTITVKSANFGNIFINPCNRREKEFGAQLMYWVLEQAGSPAITGPEGALTTAPDRVKTGYRVLVFDGCRTELYVDAIRRTPGFDSVTTDIIATKNAADWAISSEVATTFLKSLLAQQSIEETVAAMNATDRTGSVAAEITTFGIDDNALGK